jgi:hypothetical protein
MLPIIAGFHGFKTSSELVVDGWCLVVGILGVCLAGYTRAAGRAAAGAGRDGGIACTLFQQDIFICCPLSHGAVGSEPALRHGDARLQGIRQAYRAAARFG